MIRLFIKKQFESYSDFVIWKRAHLDGAYITITKRKNRNMNDCQIEMTIVGWIRYNDRVA